jgi:acetolactate synthase-1/3 small subunit
VVERELVMMRVKVDAIAAPRSCRCATFSARKIIDVQHNNLAIEITGNESKIDKFLMLMGQVWQSSN